MKVATMVATITKAMAMATATTVEISRSADLVGRQTMVLVSKPMEILDSKVTTFITVMEVTTRVLGAMSRRRSLESDSSG
jgi:hypothetical protein